MNVPIELPPEIMALISALEHAQVGVLVHRDATVIFANRAMRFMLGYRLDSNELNGVRVGEALFHPDDRNAGREVLGGARERELRWLRRDGTAVPLETHVSSAHGAGVGALWAQRRSRTERVPAADALSDGFDVVGDCVRELHVEIATGLQTIVTNVVAGGEMLRSAAMDDALRQELAEMLGDMRLAAEAIANVTRRWKLLYASDAPLVGRVSLSTVAQRASAGLGARIANASVEVVCRETPDVEADGAQLVEVLREVLWRCAAAAAPDARALTMSVGTSGDQAWVEIRGRAGLGAERLADDLAGKIGLPSIRERMGLAVCRRILRQLGGDVRLERSPDGDGDGPAFVRVSLPRARIPGRVPSRSLQPEHFQLPSCRVLLVGEERWPFESRLEKHPRVEAVVRETSIGRALARLRGAEKFHAVFWSMTDAALGVMRLLAEQRAEAVACSVVVVPGFDGLTPAQLGSLQQHVVVTPDADAATLEAALDRVAPPT